MKNCLPKSPKKSVQMKAENCSSKGLFFELKSENNNY